MLIALDAGHGGSDPGAVYNGRREKDDNLKLAMAVGDILKNEGMDVFYTRDNDIYETPFKKATDANNSGADYFVSFHRNSGENPNAASGVQVLIYNEGGEKEHLAENILDNLTDLGFKDLGVAERPNLVVLKRTNMPAVLVETGFINNDDDNKKFDDEFDRIAAAIADGIIKTIGSGTASRDNNVLTAPDESNIKDPYEFESSVISYGSKTTCSERLQGSSFESSVISYGSKTRVQRLHALRMFESSVISYSSKTGLLQ